MFSAKIAEGLYIDQKNPMNQKTITEPVVRHILYLPSVGAEDIGLLFALYGQDIRVLRKASFISGPPYRHPLSDYGQGSFSSHDNIKTSRSLKSITPSRYRSVSLGSGISREDSVSAR